MYAHSFALSEHLNHRKRRPKAMETKNIMIVGVGGQGSLLASKLLGHLLMSQGYDVKVSEVHGMSQRGGSVVTYVRYGEKVYSPVIDKGEADYIVSFELLEAARWLPFLKKDGQIVTNTQQIDPMPVITGVAEYPEDLVNKLKATGAKVDALDCLSLAEEAGSSKAVNIVLLGRLSHYFALPEEAWMKSLEANVPAKFLDMNKKAFELGKNFAN
jgi:indolepyruvate ferredoxin oxidoreductase beta subunit